MGFMYEIHSWAVINESLTGEDEDHLDEIIAQIQKAIDELAWNQPYGFMKLYLVNGNYHFTCSVDRNRRDQVVSEAYQVYEFIAKLAPGSYGILYAHDDEDPGFGQHFRVYVMKRGMITEHGDPFLSPRNPTIEENPVYND
jgi:hypothetical protein